MSAKVRVLSEITINKIAAGEVIENAASVVKELVENALDAGASQVTVEILSGGRQMIRVSDNGCGMARDDALLCLERHATSKISDVDDLMDLSTLGFRGEAIPSIASISKFSLITYPAGGAEGTHLVVEGGKLLRCDAAARAPGTTIEVKGLFFNVPARRKFQKSASHDAGEVHRLMVLLALAHPHISFRLMNHDETVLETGGSKNLSPEDLLSMRVQEVLGKDFFSSLIPIDHQEEGYRLYGLIGIPAYTRHNRTGQYLFINNRAVVSPLVSAAVLEGYGTRLEPRRYPVFVLHWEIPGDSVDVNVHPQKKEVRLHQEGICRQRILTAIDKALSHRMPPGQPVEAPSRLPINSGTYQKAPLYYAKPYYNTPATYPPLLDIAPTLSQDPIHPKIDPQGILPWEVTPSSSHKPPLQEARESLFADNVTMITDEEPYKPVVPRRPPRVCALLLPYLVLDANPCAQDNRSTEFSGVCLVDIKAARSRVLFEELARTLEDPSAGREVQMLLLPITLECNTLESASLQDHLKTFERLGFSIRLLGGRTFVIDAIPACLEHVDTAELIHRLLADLQEGVVKNTVAQQKERRLAATASRLAAQGVKRMTLTEGQALVDALVRCVQPWQCPSGLPTVAVISPQEVAKKFEHN